MPAVQRAAHPGELHRLCARVLLRFLEGGRPKLAAYTPPSEGEAASDAHANDTEAAVGGWASLQADAAPDEVHWFSIRLERRRFPWLWRRGAPQRLISSLEMLGLVFLIMLLASLRKGTWRAQVRFRAITEC